MSRTMMRRFECGHVEFTGMSYSTESAFNGIHLSVAGDCQQCRDPNAKEEDKPHKWTPFQWQEFVDYLKTLS